MRKIQNARKQQKQKLPTDEKTDRQLPLEDTIFDQDQRDCVRWKEKLSADLAGTVVRGKYPL